MGWCSLGWCSWLASRRRLGCLRRRGRWCGYGGCHRGWDGAGDPCGRTGARGRGLGGDRRGAGDRLDRLGGRGLLLDPGGSGHADALLEVSGALRCAAGPLTQPLELARLGEDEQR